jgi:hypothetical protein
MNEWMDGGWDGYVFVMSTVCTYIIKTKKMKNEKYKIIKEKYKVINKKKI